MPFGVGDFVATVPLIETIISTCRTSSNAAREYQELLRELDGLKRALTEIDNLKVPETQQAALDAIRLTALSCQRILEKFLPRIQKYEKRLGEQKSIEGKMVTTVKKRLLWSLDGAKDAQKLTNYLAVHVASVNTQLLTLEL